MNDVMDAVRVRSLRLMKMPMLNSISQSIHAAEAENLSRTGDVARQLAGLRDQLQQNQRDWHHQFRDITERVQFLHESLFSANPHRQPPPPPPPRGMSIKLVIVTGSQLL
jgi:hypothetical protein